MKMLTNVNKTLKIKIKTFLVPILISNHESKQKLPPTKESKRRHFSFPCKTRTKRRQRASLQTPPRTSSRIYVHSCEGV